MAKSGSDKKDELKSDINAELRRLREKGPERLYLLGGPEDYLTAYFLNSLKKRCLPEGEDDFSYHLLTGPILDVDALREAVDAPPFLTERSLVEIRDADLDSGDQDTDGLLEVLSDIPETCTVVFVFPVDYEPDRRRKLVKELRARALELRFARQEERRLMSWIAKHFEARGKSIGPEATRRLIFVSGDLMNRLLPEIEKIASYAAGERITVQDVDTIAEHIPEADVFEMTEHIAKREFNSAFAILAELLEARKNDEILILSILGTQMRSLYAARLAIEENLGLKYVMEVCALKYDNHARKLLQTARGFTTEQLRSAIRICAETDRRIKSFTGDNSRLLQEAVLRIAAEASDA